MNRGLALKVLRETWMGTVLFCASLAAVELLLTYVLLSFFRDAPAILQFRVLQDVLKGMLGTEVGPTLGPEAIAAITWLHPLVLGLVWTQAVTFFTRLPAAEVERGTIDVLLSLPVSRTTAYLTTSLVGLGGGACFLAAGTVGHLAAFRFFAGDSAMPAPQVVVVALNFYAQYVAVAGLAALASACASYRARALTPALAYVAASFLHGYVARLWAPAQVLSPVNVMNYYQPLAVFMEKTWPVRDMVVLLAIGAAAWAVGGLVFARRDIRTV
ncbi:MAG: hypothetical protein HY763_10785 [Planctomycetes bacterium]|nr:hypothetical protein [Planctomycetota bacterium]